MPIPTAPIANYDFSNPLSYPGSGTTISDLEGGFNLTADATTASTFYPLNSTFTLTGGNSSYIRATTGNYVNTGTNDFSFATWFSITSFSAQPPYTFVFLNGSRSAGYTGYGLNVIGTNLGIHVSGVADIDTGFAITLGQWYYATFTVNAAGAYIVYVNGTSVYTGSGFSPNAFSGSSQLAIGYPANSFGDETFIGRIGSIEFFDSVLSGANVTTLYNDSKSRFPVFSYDFSQTLSYPGTGSTVFDLAGVTNLPISGATFGGTGQSKYFNFDGTNDYIGKNGVTGFGDTFSVSFWSKYPSAATSQMFAWSGGVYNANGGGPQSGLNSNVIDISFNNSIGFTSFSTTPDVWHNYTFTADGTTVKGYRDGSLQASTAQTAGTWENGGLYLGVPIDTGGAFYPGFYYNGQIATFDVYNTALSAGDITTIYNDTETRFFPPAPPVTPSILGGRQFAQGFNG
jgi:hypothetical protein